MSVGLEMWRFSEDINTARRFNMRIQHPHCPSVLYSGIYLIDLIFEMRNQFIKFNF